MKLGPRSVARVAAYRIGLKSGLHPVLRIKPRAVEGRFFAPMPGNAGAPGAVEEDIRYFGWLDSPVIGAAPDWFANPLTGKSGGPAERPWWTIPDFDDAVGDIKILWEPSRFTWCLDLAHRARGGDAGAAETLERWLQDWVAKNPAYLGPNWKCGQESSIRVMHLAMAQLLLSDEVAPGPALGALVFNHLQRIAPTIGYAVGQDNNHGTSEAAALFIGGSWLERAGEPAGRKWHAAGRRWLEERVLRLVAEDGGFSQYSLNYHRVMLDTLCMAEVWRRRLVLPDFSPAFRARALAATRWLHAMIDPRSGDGPNVGANDGAHLFNIGGTPYRDFRPTVQTATILFGGARAYAGNGPWNSHAEALGLEMPDRLVDAPGSAQFDASGFSLLREGEAMAMLRYARFRHRPSQSDALHVDLWLDGENLLGDAGTYSYNSGQEWLAYFSGTESHNTVMFDGRDQMPRLGRFLFGAWLKSRDVAAHAHDAQAAYTDSWGASHKRSVVLEADRLVVTDVISGFAGSAILRWRLRAGAWQATGPGCVSDGAHQLAVEVKTGSGALKLGQGQRSLFYLRKEDVPVASLEVTEPTIITSTYSWA